MNFEKSVGTQIYMAKWTLIYSSVQKKFNLETQTWSMAATNYIFQQLQLTVSQLRKFTLGSQLQ